MTDYFYQEKDQVIALIHEESYGKCQGNTSAWAKCDNPTNFKGLDLVHKGPDLSPTIREKIDYFGVGGGKYPAMIVNAMHNPIEITLDMPLQCGRFLSYAIGKATHTGSVAEVTEITCPAGSTFAASGDADYILIDCINDSDTIIQNYIWFDVDDGCDDPAVSGRTGIECDIASTDSAAQVATKLSVKINNEANYGASVATAVVTVTNAYAGAVIDAKDGVSSGCTFSITTQGASVEDIPESINHSMESFCLHVEQKNTTGAETIIYELLGCIVKSITYHIGYNENDGQIMQSVNITSPYAVILADTDKLASPPSYIDSTPFNFGNVDETSDKILEENSGDILPDAVSLLEFTIENTITFMPDVGNTYFTDFTCADRKISLHIVGFNKKSTIFDFWRDLWDQANKRFSTATTQICSSIKLTRSTNDYIKIFVYNWKIASYACRFFNVQEGSLRSEDFTLNSATPLASNSNRMLCDSSSNNCEIKDSEPYTTYHHTT